MMTAYQNRRLNQLTDLLMFKEITKSEYTEYEYLCELLAYEFTTQQPSNRRNQAR